MSSSRTRTSASTPVAPPVAPRGEDRTQRQRPRPSPPAATLPRPSSLRAGGDGEDAEAAEGSSRNLHGGGLVQELTRRPVALTGAREHPAGLEKT